MALTVSGDIRYFMPALTDIFAGSGWSKFAFGGWLRVNTGAGNNNLAVMFQDTPASAFGFGFNGTNVVNTAVADNGSQVISINKTFAYGQNYYFLHVLDSGAAHSTVYWNASPTNGNITQPWLLKSGQRKLEVALDALNGALTSITIQDFVVFSGYAPTQADAINLTQRVVTPLQVGPGAFIWYPFSGASGTSPTPASSGMLNWGTGGSGKYSLNGGTLWGSPSGNGVFTSENMSLQPAVNTTKYVTQNSGQVAVVFRKNTDNSLSYNPTVNVNPNVTVNTTGNLTFIQLTGGVTYSTAAYILYDLGNTYIPSNAVVTYNMQAGWAQTNDGLCIAETGTLTNYAGGNLWAIPPSATCQWGFNIISQEDWSIKNWFRKIPSNFGLFNAASSTPDGRPLSFVGNVGQAVVWNNSPANGVDSNRIPMPTGLWALLYTDHPTFSSTLYLTGSEFNFTPQPLSSYSNVMSGVRYTGNQYIATTGGLYGGGVFLNWIPLSPTGLNADNIWIISPENSLDTSDPYAVDASLLKYVATTGQKFCPVVRIMAMIHGGAGDPNIVTQNDFLNPTGFQWYYPNRKIQALYVRPYDLTVSPSALIDAIGWIKPSSIDYMFNAGNPNVRFTYEVVTSGNHGLHSSNWVNPFNVGFPPVNVSGVDGYVYQVSSFVQGVQSVIVTSPSSFVLVNFETSSITSGTHIKTPIGTTNATGLYYMFTPAAMGSNKPWEAIFKVPASISGATMWTSAPLGATDSTHAAIAKIAFNTLPAGRKVIVEYSNECWNNSFIQAAYLTEIANFYGINADEYYTLRASQIHDIWDSVFSSGGRPNSIVRLFANQYTPVMAGFSNIINALLKYNLPAHALAFAPYEDFLVGDISVTGAQASWNYDKVHDLYRHHLWYNSHDHSAFTAATGLINTYKQITGTGLSLYAYEAANEFTFNPDIPQASIKAVDMFYHREAYNTRNAYHLFCQQQGLNLGCYFALYSLVIAGGNTASLTDWYPTVRWPGQGWGIGENNKMSINDGISHEITNVLPVMQAWKDWNDRTASVPVIPNLPTVIAENPSANTINVTGVPPITVSFNKSIVPSSISFLLYDNNHSLLPVSTQVSYFTATVTPSSNLLAGTAYTLQVSGLQDTVGLSQQSPFTFNFNQGSAFAITAFTPPASSVNNSILSTISVTFNNPIQTGTLSFTLKDISGNNIPGTVQFL